MSLAAIPKIQIVEVRDNFGRFVAEPLENGFGVTLGNSLRRIMLGHLPGAAITHVKIDGIHHEFTTIPHVKEDVIDFLLNVKSIRIKPLTNQPGKLYLDVSGEGVVTAADIKPSVDFEIVNPELHLATLDSKNARLYVEFDVQPGVGFKAAENGENQMVDVIPVDAIFTPVRKVNYIIEPLHLGQETTLERLYLEVWTDGTIAAEDALSQSARLLNDLLQPFIGFGKAPVLSIEHETAGDETTNEHFNTPVEQLNLSVRTMNCLRRGNITTVGEIIARGERGLMTLRNFGIKSLRELEERLGELGLSMKSDDSEDYDETATEEPEE